MPSNLPIFTLRTTDLVLKKLRFIAGVEGISANKLLEGLLLDKIEEFEREHGEIPDTESGPPR